MPRPAGSGRKRGTPNKVTAEIREQAQKLFDKPYFDALKKRLRFGTCAPAVEVTMLHYAFGAPPKEHKHSGKVSLERIIAGTVVDDGDDA